MKHWLKAAAVCAVVVCLCASLFACGKGSAGLIENSEWKNNASVVSRNKELSHSPIVSYDSIDEALKADIKASSRYLSLTASGNSISLRKKATFPPDSRTRILIRARGIPFACPATGKRRDSLLPITDMTIIHGIRPH